MTKIFPSPIFPVRADSVMMATTESTSFSLITISIWILGRISTVIRPPRYSRDMPFCSPRPRTSVMVMLMKLFSSSAFLMNSNRSGLMIAFTSFIPNPSLSAALPVLRDVKADILFFFRHPQSNRLVNDECEDVCYDKCVDQGSTGANYLSNELVDISFQKPRCSIDRCCREDAGCECAPEAAHAVDCPGIKAFVNPPFLSEEHDAVTEHTGNCTDDNRGHGCHISGCRCNCDKTGYGTGYEPERARLATVCPADKQPCHRRGRGCGVGSDECFNSKTIRSDRASSIEPEPAEP